MVAFERSKQSDWTVTSTIGKTVVMVTAAALIDPGKQITQAGYGRRSLRRVLPEGCVQLGQGSPDALIVVVAQIYQGVSGPPTQG